MILINYYFNDSEKLHYYLMYFGYIVQFRNYNIIKVEKW